MCGCPEAQIGVSVGHRKFGSPRSSRRRSALAMYDGSRSSEPCSASLSARLQQVWALCTARYQPYFRNICSHRDFDHPVTPEVNREVLFSDGID